MALLCKNVKNIHTFNDISKTSLRFTNWLRAETIDEHRSSKFNKTRMEEPKKQFSPAPKDFKQMCPEFLPDPNIKNRDRVKEILEREDMLKRRSVISIPEFYVGSIMAVTVVDPHAADKLNRFVGICIQKTGVGLRANFTLRNFIDQQGIEITYDMYSPQLQKIEVLKLEKRLDDELFYLRDAADEYSTFPFDFPVIQHPPNEPVPINTTKVTLCRKNAPNKPWHQRWERMNLKGAEVLELSERMVKQLQNPACTKPWDQYDLMKQYRAKINDKETDDIMAEVFDQISKIDKAKRPPPKMNGKSRSKS